MPFTNAIFCEVLVPVHPALRHSHGPHLAPCVVADPAQHSRPRPSRVYVGRRPVQGAIDATQLSLLWTPGAALSV